MVTTDEVTRGRLTLDEAVERARRFRERAGSNTTLRVERLDHRETQVDDVRKALEALPGHTREVLLIARVESAGDAARAGFDEAAIGLGFRRHPLLFDCVSYHELESESGWMLLPYERLTDTALRRYPWDVLVEERYLHMDMTRAAGRRSDAHLARYRFASERIGRGARVLDAACGLGYGSALMWRESPTRSIVGLDLASWVVDYATINFGNDPHLRYQQADASDLSNFANGSFDAVVSFETIEHLLDPAPFLRHVRRVLADDGLFVASVPYRWVVDGDTGPYHHDWYDASKLLELCGRFLNVDDLWVQTAGGGYYCPDLVRTWRRVPAIAEEPDGPIEWLNVIARKRPAVSSRAKSWLCVSPGVGELTTMAAALAEWGARAGEVHVVGSTSHGDDEFHQAMAESCDAFGFEYGGNLPLQPAIDIVGDPLDHAPEESEDETAARAGCGARVRDAYPVLDGLQDLNVAIAVRPDMPSDYALVAGLHPKQLRLVAGPLDDDRHTRDFTGKRGFEDNALARLPIDAEVVCPPHHETRVDAIGRSRALDARSYADATARVGMAPSAQILAREIVQRPTPFTAVVVSEPFCRRGLTSDEAGWIFYLHLVRTLLQGGHGAVLFKAHPSDSHRKIAALRDALGDDGDRVHVTTGVERHFPLEAFPDLAARVPALEIWGTSSSALIGVTRWPGVTARCADADYLEPEIRRQAREVSRRHAVPLTTLRFDDSILTGSERTRLRRQFRLPRTEGQTAALTAQLREAEHTRRAARARAEDMAARVAAVERLAGDSVLMEALLIRNKADTWIWGSGAAGRRLLQRLRSLGVEPVGFLDSRAEPPQRDVDRVAVHSADIAMQAREPAALVVIASMHADEILRRIQTDACWRSTVIVWTER